MPGAVVLVLDGLGAKHLGPYGNTWIETRAFNRLATESLLIDGLYAPCCDRRRLLSALGGDEQNYLVRSASLRGMHTQLLTDDRDLLDDPLVADFSHQDEVEMLESVEVADAWDHTHAARFFAQAIQLIEQAPDDSLTWLHTSGLTHRWDAPLEYRQMFVEEDDPEPSHAAQVPRLHLDADFDPDTVHSMQCAYAGQVVLIDQCLSGLLSVLRPLAAERNWMFLLTSLSGFPLGEHLQVGDHSPGSLYHESLWVPAFVRYPNGCLAMKRRSGLAEFSDLAECLEQWILHEQWWDTTEERSFSVSRLDEQWLLRTPFWQMTFPRLDSQFESASEGAELYLKPDDQNEVNNVADRCPDVLRAGFELLLEFRSTANRELAVPARLLEPAE